MIKIRLLWPYLIELIVLFLLLGLLIEIFVTNSKKVDEYAQKMWELTRKAQELVQQVDHEFDVINKCAKSIKGGFVNLGKVYKEIGEGTKTIDEALKEVRNNIPEEFSALCLPAEESATESTATDSKCDGLNSLSDLDVKLNLIFSDDRQFSTKATQSSMACSLGRMSSEY